MYIDGRIQLWAPLVEVYDGLNGQWPSTLCPVEGEVPALAAGAPALEAKGAAEEHAESAVRAHLGERAFLTAHKRLSASLFSVHLY